VYAEKNGVKRSVQQIKTSSFILKTQLKAYISRNIFENAGFYPIIQELDKTLYVAIKEMGKQKTGEIYR
jgi:carboxyl-terminal processing protease